MDPERARLLSGGRRTMIQDTTREEEKFERKYTLRGMFYDHNFWSGYAVIIILITLSSLAVIVTGVWSLVKCTMLLPTITTQANFPLSILSVLFIIVGVVAIALVVGFSLFMKYERPTKSDILRNFLKATSKAILVSLIVILTALGIAAGALIPSLSGSIESSAYSSLFAVHDSQEAKDAWDTAQSTLKCCGVVNFSDYELVFINFSVPVSCCNTTNPLVNETTCPDIVMDTNVGNATELIYAEGCAPKFLPFYHYILSVVAGVGVTIGAAPISVGLYLSFLIGLTRCQSRKNCCDSSVCDSSVCVSKDISRYESETCHDNMYCIIIGSILVLCLAIVSVAVWALVQIKSFYDPIIAPANSNIVTLSSMLLVTGILVSCITLCGGKIESSPGRYGFSCLCIIPMFTISAIVIGAVAYNMRGPTSTELNDTLHKYLKNQTIQETWNDLQKNMECCGVSNFSDYETVFNNFSVPESCCNTTNPLASKCPGIVRNTQQIINQTGLIYSEGCCTVKTKVVISHRRCENCLTFPTFGGKMWSHLESFFNICFTVTAAVSFTIAGLLFAAVLICLCCCCSLVIS